MKKLKIRELIIGEGMPKICVPIVGKTKEEICLDAQRMMEQVVLPDLVEWRADCFLNITDEEQMFEILQMLRKTFINLPVLFTLRTKKEGGEYGLSYEAYEKKLLQVSESGFADAVDIEAFFEEERTAGLIAQVKRCGVVAVASNHDFLKTPPKEEMVRRLLKMKEWNADIAKLAVMPKNRQDVMALLEVTKEVSEQEAMCPLITMSMSELGGISRLCGEMSNSTVTFACVGKVSAPGQMEIEEVKRGLRFVHSCLK